MTNFNEVMTLQYQPFEEQFRDALYNLIFGLYQADAAGEEMTSEKIERSIEAFQINPSLGHIILVLFDNQPIGYALLINYWSNEYSGIIMFIDEFYIDSPYRSKSIGTQFLNHLINERFTYAVAFALEVMPDNTRAQEMYKRCGFAPDGRTHLFYQREMV